LLVHRIFAPLKAALPQWLSRPIRAIFTALLGPACFAFQTGHFRSSLASKAVDRLGRPLPWYSYPAIDLLRTKTFSGRSVLEFGAGQSTIWWAQHAEKVVSLEGDPAWYEYIRRKMPHNVSLYLSDDGLTKFGELVADESRFDVIIVDGLNRFNAVVKSHKMLKPGGLFIVDNSEGYWGSEGTYPIITLLKSAGYARVDFYGFSPGNVMRSCTSFFFRNTCFLFDGDEPPKLPIP
jgi:precorrin-6B methylase 2